ncbi:MAG: class I SAM-dependent methyltransferase, partial [Candidatus Rokuibacteriota bacterium]
GHPGGTAVAAHLAMPSTPARPTSTWSPWAREYARNPERYVFGTAPSDWAVDIARLVRPGDSVLDLGCGEGRDSVFFAELGAEVTGVDLSVDGLHKARRLARRRGVRVRWIEGPMTAPLPPGPYTLIFSCGTIHYVPRVQRHPLFRRLGAMTRPGGHHAHVVFTDRLVHEEKGEIVDYFTTGELREAFVEWRILRAAEHVISCAQDGSVHGHSVEELVAARPVGPAPRPSET